jgi:glycosyltransferase involved in cell wall biosynthesis
VVEYLALGLPVACTPLEGVRRYFQNEPLVRFSGFDGASLGEVILQWLREPKTARVAWAEPAARRVRERLDWSVVCSRAVAVVESTLAAARTG